MEKGPAYAEMVDRIAMEPLVLRPEGQLLRPYLQAHPRRVADLRRLLPQGLHGVEAHWSIRGGELLLEHLQLPEGYDAVEEMLLWRALFPGLRAPLPAWWVSGNWPCRAHGRDTCMQFSYRKTLTLVQGRVPQPGAKDDSAIPFWFRLALLPLYPVGLPLLFAWMWWKLMRKEPMRIQWLNLRLMVILYLTVPYWLLHPRMESLPFLARLRDGLQARREDVAMHHMIEELVRPEQR